MTVLITFLISCPIRMRNLASIEVGRHLVWDGQNYQLHFTAAEIKTRRPYAASVPPDLTPYIDGWLHVDRKTLQSIALAKGNQHGRPPLVGSLGATYEQPGDPAAD